MWNPKEFWKPGTTSRLWSARERLGTRGSRSSFLGASKRSSRRRLMMMRTVPAVLGSIARDEPSATRRVSLGRRLARRRFPPTRPPRARSGLSARGLVPDMRARRFLAAFLAVFASRASRVAAAEPLADGSASSAASAPWSFEPWAGDRGLDLDDANAWVSRLRRRAEDIADARDDVDAAYRPLFASISDASERPRAGVDAFRGAGGLDRWRGRGWRFDDVDDDDEPPSSSAATPDPLDGVGEVVLDALEISSDCLLYTSPSPRD